MIAHIWKKYMFSFGFYFPEYDCFSSFHWFSCDASAPDMSASSFKILLLF